MKDKLVIEIPIPKFAVPVLAVPTAAKRIGNRVGSRVSREGALLFLSSLFLVICAVYTIYYHAIELWWINGDPNLRFSNRVGIDVIIGGETRKINWRPVLLYRSPHHHLAISAASMCIMVVGTLPIIYEAARRPKRAFRARLALGFLLVSAITITATALFYNFIEASASGRVDGWALHEYSKLNEYGLYRDTWMDLEAWTCGIRSWARDHKRGGQWQGPRAILDPLCEKAVKGRQLLVPVFVLLLVVAVISSVLFKDQARKNGYEKVGSLDEEEGKEEETRGLLLVDEEEAGLERKPARKDGYERVRSSDDGERKEEEVRGPL